MRVTKSGIVWTTVILVGVAGIALALRPRAVEVETGTVARGRLTITVDEEGATRLRQRYVVSAPVAGRVQRIELRPGDTVARGRTTIAMIEPAPPTPIDARDRAVAEARVDAAEAAVGRVRADAERAAVEVERATEAATRIHKLFEAGSVSKEEVEAADARLRSTKEGQRSADFAVRAAEFEAAQARAVLTSSTDAQAGRAITVHAPVDGVVLRRLQESETVVAPGTPLVEVGNPQDLEIVADLLSTDAVRVQPGAAVAIDGWGGDHPLAGTVDRVEPSGFMKVSALGVEEQRVNVVVAFADPPDARPTLGDGFRVEVRITVWDRPDVLKLPTSSLFRQDGDWAVFVVHDGQLTKRRVTIGQRNDREAEVVDGVTAGDVVVVYPGESLNDGTRVVVR